MKNHNNSFGQPICLGCSAPIKGQPKEVDTSFGLLKIHADSGKNDKGKKNPYNCPQMLEQNVKTAGGTMGEKKKAE